jgi:hypothetical protein
MRGKLYAISATIGVAVGVACSEGPFARANPYDPQADFEFELRASRDSAFAIGDRVLYQLVSDPPHPITARIWGTDRPDLLLHLGNGYYHVSALPPNPVTVHVFVQLGIRADTATLVVMPP